MERPMARAPGLVGLLLGCLLSGPALADGPVAFPPATPQQVHQAVDRAVGYLRTESAAWLSQRTCAACHHAPLPLWALGEADRQGYAIDRKYVADTIEGALGSADKMIAARLAAGPKDPPDTRPIARGVNMGQVFMAFAARTQPAPTPGQIQSVRRIADDIVKKQREDGSWEFFLSRPPINESQA